MKPILQALVLSELNKSELNGYQLMQKIAEITGESISSGTMYPLLKRLLIQKFITKRKEGKANIYSLTKEGKLKYAEIQKNKQKTMIDSFKVYKSLLTKKEYDFANKKISKILKNELIEKHVDLEYKIKCALSKLIFSKNFDKKKIKLKKILEDTIKKIEELTKE